MNLEKIYGFAARLRVLFVTQGDDGVDLGGAARGDVAGQHCGQSKY
jgi:hypothetical protein